MITDILKNFNSDDFILSTYRSHLDLYHQRKEKYDKAASFSRQQVIYYGGQCIDKGLLTREQFELDLLPRVDFKQLFNELKDEPTEGSLAPDGEE